MIDVHFFREIYTFARAHFETDRATYHISAQLNRAPLPEAVSNWPGLLDQFDAREILHVTFGSVLTDHAVHGDQGFYPHFMELLQSNAEAYAENLKNHFVRHLNQFLIKD